MDFGKALRRERRLIEMSQAKLAEEVGCDYQAIAKWEMGRALPDYKRFLKVCKILKMDPNDFMEE